MNTLSLTGHAAALPNPKSQLSAANVHRETTYPKGAGVSGIIVWTIGEEGTVPRIPSCIR